MKALILTAALTTAFGTASISAAPLDTVTQNKLVTVCKAIQSGSKLELLKVMRHNRLSYDTIISDLRCNGMSVVAFAQQSNNEVTANYLASRKASNAARVTGKSGKVAKKSCSRSRVVCPVFAYFMPQSVGDIKSDIRFSAHKLHPLSTPATLWRKTSSEWASNQGFRACQRLLRPDGCGSE